MLRYAHSRLTTITSMRPFLFSLPVGSRSRLRAYNVSVLKQIAWHKRHVQQRPREGDYIWHSNTDKIVNASNIWANFFMCSTMATILSNGMPIYGQTVLYIWSKLSMLNVCAKCFQRYGQTFFMCKIFINIWANMYENIMCSTF